MGAKIIPMAKKSGRTVFGVRMGLGSRCQLDESETKEKSYCHAFNRCCRKAVSNTGPLSLTYLFDWKEAWSYLRAFCFWLFWELLGHDLGVGWSRYERVVFAT